MKPPGFVRDPALVAVMQALPGARVVGGAVRDALARRPVSDIDLATPDPPDRVIAALAAAGLKHAPTGLQHGTVTAIARGRGFEVTTLRRDEQTDGRHATVAWTDSWEEDAARRDFTINAMSMCRDGEVFDYFGGRADLEARRVRFVGDPALRVAEDHLRVLRFFRFHGRYGDAAPDEATAAALRDGAGFLGALSVERVWSELKRVVVVPDAVRTVRLMDGLGVLSAVLPGADADAFDRLVRQGGPADPLLRLAALRPGPGTAERFKLSKVEATTLAGLDGPVPDPAADDDALRRALVDTPAELLAGRAWLAGGGDPAWAALRARMAVEPRPVFPLAGRDVVASGVPRGPEVGRVLGAVRAWWMAGGCLADAAGCRAELGRLLAGADAG